jgi:type I restriction enzyme S subunit
MKFERLGEKIIQVRGISYKPSDISAIPMPDYVPILKANNIQEEGIDTRDLIYIHKSKVKPEQFIKKGDLLLAASSGSKEIVGKNIYFERDFEGSFGAFCKLVRPKKNINSRYLATFFKSVPYKRHIKKLLSGALINNLKNEYLDSLLIPELSDSDQLHIANLLSKAENLIAQRKESIRLLDDFLKSTFLEMFGDPVRNEKGWEKVVLGNVSKKIGSGSTPRGGKESYHKEGISLIRSLNVHNDEFVYKDLAFIDDKQAHELRNVIVEENDVLLNITGASVARCCIVPKDILPARVNQHVSILRPETNVLNPLFLSRMFTSENYQLKLVKDAKSKGATREAITKEEIELMKVIAPPIELQTQFAQIVEKIEALKTQYQQSLKELENLYGSLSQKAFKGELTPTQNQVNP